MALPELKRADIGAGHISYREKGGGTPLVFVHGLGGRSGVWETQYEVFSDRFRVIGWDAPGYGESTNLETETPSIAHYVEVLARFIDALEIDRMHLVGHSVGTVIVTAFHGHYPDRLLSLTLAEAVTGSGMEDEEARAAKIRDREAEIDRIGVEEFARTRAPNSVSPGASDAIRQRAVENAMRMQVPGYKRAHRALVGANIFDEIAPLRVPAMIVAGADDRSAPAEMVRRIADAMPGIRHEVIPDIGHQIFLEHPERFNGLLESHLAAAAEERAAASAAE